MNEVKCPHCNKQFELDETGYAHLMKEVRDEEFKKEIAQIKESLEKKYKSDLESQTMKLTTSYENKLREKDETINYYRDFKTRLSTKGVGESLELYCSNEFNKIRMTGFQNVYFEKDNDAGDGTKGDFIYREFAEDGTELLSIMFEMKNEMDTTASKHKNEDFFAKLDKDRTKKNCEYAVLVSLLEIDNDLYNNGIVDVSYRFDKMYVIRPQCFIPMITILRNAALRSSEYKKEIHELREHQVDLVNFESNLTDFQKKVNDKLESSADKYEDALKKIQTSIDALEKAKQALLDSREYLGKADGEAQKITITALTRKAPSVRKELKEISKQNENGDN